MKRTYINASSFGKDLTAHGGGKTFIVDIRRVIVELSVVRYRILGIWTMINLK